DSAQQIPQRGSDRDREIKHSHHPPSLFGGEHVGDKGWRENDKAGLADAHQGMANEQFIEVAGEGGEESSPAPHQGSSDDDALARETQRKRPHERRRAHVKDEKDGG